MRALLEILGPVIFGGIGYAVGDGIGMAVGLVIYIILRLGAFEALANVFD